MFQYEKLHKLKMTIKSSKEQQINYLRHADSVKDGGYFFYAGKREKHLLGSFKGFFMEIETFWISIKNPEKGPNKCFSQVKKISSQTLQNSRDVGSFMSHV